MGWGGVGGKRGVKERAQTQIRIKTSKKKIKKKRRWSERSISNPKRLRAHYYNHYNSTRFVLQCLPLWHTLTYSCWSHIQYCIFFSNHCIYTCLSSHLSIFISAVHFKASFKPPWVAQRDLLTLVLPSLVLLTFPHPSTHLLHPTWWLSMLGLATEGTTQWHCE